MPIYPIVFMPVNAPVEYFIAEQRFRDAKGKEEKILAMEEMIRLLPKHHGSEQALAQLKSKLAKLRKETAKKGSHKIGIVKEGEAQVCIMGFPNSGKSTLLRKLTAAKPAVSGVPYTTTKPEIGMMDYKGVKVQLIELPSTFEPEFLSVARTSDGIVALAGSREEKNRMTRLLQDNFIQAKRIFMNLSDIDAKEKIWGMLGLIIAYTKTGRGNSPMALPAGSTVKDFALRIHKDFVENFRFARLWRKENGRVFQRNVGLSYMLKDGDVVEIHAK